MSKVFVYFFVKIFNQVCGFLVYFMILKYLVELLFDEILVIDINICRYCMQIKVVYIDDGQLKLYYLLIVKEGDKKEI